MATLALSVNIIYTLGCAFVSLIVLFLNPIIISVIYNDHQLRRQPSIIYIVNLALVDLCLAAVTFTTTLFRFLHLMALYPLCLLLHLYLPFALITASLLLMFTNSVDRFIFIRMSLKYHSLMNSRIAKRVALGIWTYSAAFPLLAYIICDPFWKYDTCSQITATQTYRYLHIPIQATFFSTIVFTILMFISVFRVVKNSRRLRHVPTRSSSMDSLSTTVSSPTLNISIPSLPPIQELIPYEHEQSSEDVCPTETQCTSSGSRWRRLRTESEQCCLPATACCVSVHKSLPTTNDDIPVGANLLHKSLPATNDDIPVGANLPHKSLQATNDNIPVGTNLLRARDILSLNASLLGTRDVISVRACLQTGKALPDLILSQLWLDDATGSCLHETDTAIIDSVSEFLFADVRSDLVNTSPVVTDGSNISVSERSSVTPDLVIKSVDVLVGSTDNVAESHDEICSCLMRAAGVGEPEPGNYALEGDNQPNPDMSLEVMVPEEITALHQSASLNLATAQPAVPASNHEQVSLPAISRLWKVSKPCRKHEHSFRGNKNVGKRQLGPKINTFLKSQGYKMKFTSSLHSYRAKMKSTIPREPLEMLNFKLEQWSSSEMTKQSQTYEDETSFSSVVTTTQMSIRRSRTPAANLLTTTNSNMLQLTAWPPLRARRRSVSTSDNSSTISVDSLSSLSHVTTESTVTSEGTTATGLQTNNTTSSIPADASLRGLRAAFSQRTDIGSFSDPSAESLWRPVRDLPHRRRVVSVRDLRLSTRRPPLVRRLSSYNHSSDVERPRQQPTWFRRTYSRSVSTLTSSSTSSIPFGSASYSGRDIRTLKILFLMFCVYIMLWLPAFVIQVLRYLDYDISIELTLIVYTLGISNSVFNFFVYPMRIPKLRVSFQKLFQSAIADAKRSVNRCTSVIKRR